MTQTKAFSLTMTKERCALIMENFTFTTNLSSVSSIERVSAIMAIILAIYLAVIDVLMLYLLGE